MFKIKIQDFDGCLLGFQVCKIKSSIVLWIDTKNDILIAKGIADKESFKQEYSYGIVDNLHFEEIHFDKDDIKTVYAEIYPAGANGGGARVGLHKSVHIKGIGQNILVGANSDRWHSYGGLSLYDSIVEIINTKIGNAILPFGVTECLGLIYSGHRTALQPNGEFHDRGPGALLVRKSLIRPAHFMESVGFTPLPLNGDLNLNEPDRTGENIFKLIELLGGESELVSLINYFIDTHAAQLSCSKLNRFYHGSFSQSNTSLLGIWVDMATASFLPAGADYQFNDSLLSFYNEHFIIIRVLKNFILQINKSTGMNICPDEFYRRFSIKINSLSAYYSTEIFGVPSNLLPFVPEEYSEIVIAEIWSIFFDNKEKLNSVPVGYFFEDSFHLKLKETINNILHNNDEIILVRTLSCIYNALHSNTDCGIAVKISVCAFLKALSIRALRRNVFSPLFYRGNIQEFIKSSLTSFDKIEHLIKSYDTAVSWIFDNDIYDVTFFRNDQIEIYYSAKSQNYNYRLGGQNENIVVDNIKLWLTEFPKSNFYFLNHDCFPMILSIVNAVEI